jgi:hypothetical protein
MTKRVPKGTAWSRRNKISTNWVDGEFADLKLIAEAWDVQPAEVIWGVISTWLSDRRGRDIMNLPYRTRSREVLERLRGDEAKGEEQRKADTPFPITDEGPGGDLRGRLYGDDWENREGGADDPSEPTDKPGI